MKNCILLLSLLFLFSCAQEEKAPKITTAKLSGTITNPKAETAKLSNGDDKFTGNLEDGKFTMDITINKPGYYNFSHGSESTKMYIEPGDDINITLDPAEFDETITYSGTGAEESNYLAAKYMLAEKEGGSSEELYSNDESTFTTKVAALKEMKTAHFDQYQKEHTNLNADFIANEKTDILYSWAIQRQRFERYHQHYAKNKEFKVSETYNDYRKDLETDNGDMLSSSTYKSFISGHYEAMASKLMDEDKSLEEDKSTGWLKAQLQTFSSSVKNADVKNYLTYGALKDQISFTGTDGIDSYMADFKKQPGNEEKATELQELYDKWAVLAKGELAPGFKYADIDGKMVALEEFRGKSVYIDVWATWCGPCKKEIPHLEEIQEHYKGNDNIVFASVSIDEDKEAWEKMVTEKDMMGVQLIGDDAWSSSICKDYLIRGIPRFILVDKEGKILDAKAPRPSSDEIKEILKDITTPALTSMK